MSKPNEEPRRRTLTVTGNGNIKEKPDYTEIDFSLNTTSKDYEKALAKGSEQLDDLRLALQESGFPDDALRTRKFHIDTLTHTIQIDKKGNSKEIFDGYECRHSLRLGFDIDMGLLSKGLAAIAKCPSHPRVSINFKVKDPAPLELMMLKSAGENAKAKATVLCEASGAKLGKLIKIDYSWRDFRSYSDTTYDIDVGDIECQIATRSSDFFDLFPEDVEQSDTADFIWEIE